MRHDNIPRILALLLMLALIVACILLAQPVRAAECRLEGKPEPTPWEPDEMGRRQRVGRGIKQEPPRRALLRSGPVREDETNEKEGIHDMAIIPRHNALCQLVSEHG